MKVGLWLCILAAVGGALAYDQFGNDLIAQYDQFGTAQGSPGADMSGFDFTDFMNEQSADFGDIFDPIIEGDFNTAQLIGDRWLSLQISGIYGFEKKGAQVMAEHEVVDVVPLGAADGSDGYRITTERPGAWPSRCAAPCPA
mgnify:CR=1 FL=1